MWQSFVHYGIHFLFPIAIALIFYKSQWKKALFIMIATMIVDLDHLFVTPIFDPDRCSIGFHFLHSYSAIAIYCIALLFKTTRIIALGLLIHMFADTVDCFMMAS